MISSKHFLDIFNKYNNLCKPSKRYIKDFDKPERDCILRHNLNSFNLLIEIYDFQNDSLIRNKILKNYVILNSNSIVLDIPCKCTIEIFG